MWNDQVLNVRVPRRMLHNENERAPRPSQAHGSTGTKGTYPQLADAKIKSAQLQSWAAELFHGSMAYVRMCGLTRRPRQVILARAQELSQDMRECIFALLEANMRAMYEQVGIWDPDAKKAELQHRTSRFLLVFDNNIQNPTRRRSPRNSAQAGRAQNLLGFVMWRYDVDDTNDDDLCADPGDDIVEVSYWYVTTT